MSYIDLMNHFWQIRKREYVSASEADLYYCLLNEFSGAYWPDSLPISNGFLCGVLSMTEKTLIATRLKLKQKGLIEFTSGKQNKTRTSYSLLYCKNYSTSDSTHYSTSYSTSDSTHVKKSTDKRKTKDKEEEYKKTGDVIFVTPELSEVDQTTWTKFQAWFSEQGFKYVTKLEEQLKPRQLLDLIEEFGKAPVRDILLSMENAKVKNKSVYLTALNWLRRNQTFKKAA